MIVTRILTRYATSKLATALSLLLLLVTAFPSVALAADIRQGDRVEVGPTEIIDDDLYVFAREIIVRGTVNGDVVVAGSDIRVEGPVSGDVIVAGGTLHLTGPIGGSIRAAGGTLEVAGEVGEDLVYAGGNLSTTAAVNRDALVATNQGRFDGAVGRNVLGSAGTLTLANRVGGDVQVQVGTLQLTDTAVVGGNLIYTSDKEAQIAPGAQVQGRIERVAPPDRPSPVESFIRRLIGWLQALVGLLVLGALFALLFPAFSRRTVRTLNDAPWPSLGIGCATIVVAPIVALIVFIVGLFVGGWWLALFLLALYAFALFLGYVISGLFVGRFVLDRAGQGRLHVVVALLVGLALLLLVGLVPILGPIVGLVAVLFGLGALVLTAVRVHEQRAEVPAE